MFFFPRGGGGGGGGGDSSFSDDDATFTGEAACAASVRWVPGTPEAVRRLPTAARGAKQLLSIVASTIDLGGVSSGFSDGGWSYRPVVRAGVSEALDDARRVLRGLPDLLARAAREECERVPRFLRHGRGFTPDRVAIQYLPTLGFAAKLRGARLTADLAEELADWEFAFEAPDEDAPEPLIREDADAVFGDPNAPNDFVTTRGTTSAPAFYYFTDLTRELDALVGDALTTAEDLEAEVLRDLRARTLRGARGLRQLALCVGEIDVALALARAAVAHRLARPRVVRENALRIRGGRNLLVERASGAPAVPNDADMGEPGGLPDGEAPTDDDDDDASPTEPSYGARRPRVVVITGPTQSGKSCYAYAMATIAFLAHAGSFVPAASATVGLADRVFALAASADQLATRDHRSTFTRDVDRVSRAIRAATARTILVVDEFGKGTRSADGAGLLCGFVRALAEAEAGPRAFVTTHFAEVADETLVPRHRTLRSRTCAWWRPRAGPRRSRRAPRGSLTREDEGDLEARRRRRCFCSARAGRERRGVRAPVRPGRGAPARGPRADRRAPEAGRGEATVRRLGEMAHGRRARRGEGDERDANATRTKGAGGGTPPSSRRWRTRGSTRRAGRRRSRDGSDARGGG